MEIKVIELLSLCSERDFEEWVAKGDVFSLRMFVKNNKSLTLSADTIQLLCRYCLFNKQEISNPDGVVAIKATGLVKKLAFNADRAKEIVNIVYALLWQLPESYFEIGFEQLKNAGGGYVFLNACNSYEDVLWTGQHSIMEDLFMLGMACGLVNNLTANLGIKIEPTMSYFSIRRTLIPSIETPLSELV